jgi:hypothetical protein
MSQVLPSLAFATGTKRYPTAPSSLPQPFATRKLLKGFRREPMRLAQGKAANGDRTPGITNPHSPRRPVTGGMNGDSPIFKPI